MNSENYIDTMNAPETPTPAQKRRIPPVWQGALAGGLVMKLITGLTDWSWWLWGTPFVGVAVAAVAFHWAKNRRKVKTEAVDGGSGS